MSSANTPAVEPPAPGARFVLGVRVGYNGTAKEFSAAFDALDKAVHEKHTLLQEGRKVYICVDNLMFPTKRSFSVCAEDSQTLAGMFARVGTERLDKHFQIMSAAVATSAGKFVITGNNVCVHMCFAEGAYV